MDKKTKQYRIVGEGEDGVRGIIREPRSLRVAKKALAENAEAWVSMGWRSGKFQIEVYTQAPGSDLYLWFDVDDERLKAAPQWALKKIERLTKELVHAKKESFAAALADDIVRLNRQVADLLARSKKATLTRIEERNHYEELLRNRRSRIADLMEEVADRDMQLLAIQKVLNQEVA